MARYDEAAPERPGRRGDHARLGGAGGDPGRDVVVLEHLDDPGRQAGALGDEHGVQACAQGGVVVDDDDADHR